MSRRPPTLSDVAALAGVSPMTVSRVINGRDGASAETRQRVLQAVGDLNYRPNTFAKGLKNGRSNTVGIVVPDIVNPFFPEILRGAELTARPAGYTLLFCNVVEDPAREEQALETLLEKRVDGIIVCSARLEQDRLLRAIKAHRAVVLINRAAPKSLAGTIEIDYRAGVAMAVESLVADGRHGIAYAAGPATSYSGQMRREGIRDALACHGLDLIADVPSSPDLAGGVEAARSLLSSRRPIDAVICYNDLIAISLLSVFQEASIDIPRDVAVIGCDDILAAALVSPSLSTIRVAKEDLGAAAMRMLLDRIEGRNTRQGLMIEPELVLRGTTRTPPT